MDDLSKNTGDPKDKTVMIVDDDDNIRELLEFVLKKEGFQVVQAADGEEALQKIPTGKPDLILLDLMLPRYGGFEVLRQLQSNSITKIPVLVLSGRYTDRSTAEMIRQESNVVDFIEKPVKPPVLAALVHNILKTRPPTKAKPAS